MARKWRSGCEPAARPPWRVLITDDHAPPRADVRASSTKIVILTVTDPKDSLFSVLRAGASGYLSKRMNLARLPDTLNGACNGEAAVPRKLGASVLERSRRRGPRWRQAVGAGQT